MSEETREEAETIEALRSLAERMTEELVAAKRMGLRVSVQVRTSPHHPYDPEMTVRVTKEL